MATVLHLAHVSIPHDARILRELNALSESPDLTVHAFGVREGQSRPSLQRHAIREFRVRSARAMWLPRPVRYTLVLLEMNARFLTGLRTVRPDVVHCHDTMVLPTGALAKVLVGSSVIYDAHELESDKSGQSRALSKATLLIEKVCWRSIDRLITVSPSITTWYEEHLGPKPAACILNSPEVGHASVPSKEAQGAGLREQLGIEPNAPLFVYVGMFDPGRGIELILRTFAGSRVNAHVAFIGWGSLQGQIEEAAHQHNNIHHHARVPHDQLVGFIQEATGGFCLIEDVSLSDYYCLPNKLFEYAFAGVPVIASRLPEIERVVKEYDLGVCADLDTVAIANAIGECEAAPRDLPLDRLADLSWERQAEGLRELYGNILSSAETSIAP